MEKTKAQPYWQPYYAGLGLGLVLLLSYMLLGQGLGGSGAFARLLYSIMHSVAPGHVEGNPYMAKYFADGANPLNNALVFLVIGVFTGGLISGLLAGRVRKTVEKGPNISVKGRFIFAFAGGTLMGFAARLARGCTSGQALSGGATLALGSWAFMFAVFAGGFAAAWFVRRQWL
ncbi:MAG: YeeE/YedE thiosulfate transporter family protein [Candidatus Electryonea clarkiae]|nr:YeeE/YedE thiosulfate transporter family protein [Candidatus Electryonea clarkiae]